MLANSYMDGSLHLINPLTFDKMYMFKEEDMTLPITRLVWRQTYQYE